MRRENSAIRTWKGWLEKKSAAFTRFCVLAYSEMRGTTISLSSLSITDSFIWTKIPDRSAPPPPPPRQSEAVVWPPFTIWRSVMRMI
jgi:hypothetical protein